MVIGVLQFELLIPHAMSLKDKRRVVKSLKDRLHRAFMVSVAEVGALDHHRLALMGLVVASNSVRYVTALLDRVVNRIRATPDAQLGEVRRDILHGDSLPEPEGGEGGDPLWTEGESRFADRGESGPSDEGKPV